MAKSGIIYGARGGNSYGPRLELHWSIVSQDIAKNTSHVKVISIFNVDRAISYGSNAGRSGSTTLGGSTKSYVSPTHSRTARTRTLGTTYHTVSHSSDGSFSGTLSGTFDIGSLSWAGVSISKISASGTISLDKIVRGIDESSVMLATGWADTTSSKTITFTKFSSSATVKVYVKFWDSIAVAWSSLRTISTDYTSGSQITFSESNIAEMHEKRPNYQTITVRVYIEHYQGTKVIGTVEKEAKLALKVEAPDINLDAFCEGRYQELLNSPLRAVQGIHMLRASVSGVAKNGASIERYEITFEGRSYSSNTLSKRVTQAGSLVLKAQVWDSRGFTRSATKTITSYKYKRPVLSGVKVQRYEGTTPNPVGTDYRITGTIVITPVVVDGTDVNNALWNINQGTNTRSSTILYIGTLPIENTKNMTLYYWDVFSLITTLRVTVPTGSATLVLGKNSVGVGMIPPVNSKGLFVKDNLVNGGVFGGIEYIAGPIGMTDALPSGTIKFWMTSSYITIDGINYYGWGISAKRINMRFIIFFTDHGKILTRFRLNDTENWRPWQIL